MKSSFIHLHFFLIYAVSEGNVDQNGKVSYNYVLTMTEFCVPLAAHSQVSEENAFISSLIL